MRFETETKPLFASRSTVRSPYIYICVCVFRVLRHLFQGERSLDNVDNEFLNQF
jgi:hypothetical protein